MALTPDLSQSVDDGWLIEVSAVRFCESISHMFTMSMTDLVEKKMYDRRKTIGASDAVYIQSGQWADLYDRKTSPDSPSYGLAAELGRILEPFNLELFVRETGSQLVIDPDWQENPITHSLDDWCKFLPDALTYREDVSNDNKGSANIPVEAKCINMMWRPEGLLKRYMPQLQHAMRVMGAPYCYFSVLYLNTKYEWTKVDYDPPYDDALFEKEQTFQFMLERGIRPPEYKGKRAGWV